MKYLQFLFIITTLYTINLLQAAERNLPVCKSSPNCVSSQATDTSHSIAPFKLRVAPEVAWRKLRMAIIANERMLIVDESSHFLHAEATSLIFRFVDDIYAQLDEQTNVIHIYSASRLGYSDFGVNRKRVEMLRQMLRQEDVVE